MVKGRHIGVYWLPYRMGADSEDAGESCFLPLLSLFCRWLIIRYNDSIPHEAPIISA